MFKKLYFIIFFFLINSYASTDSTIAYIDIDYIVNNSKFSNELLKNFKENRNKKIDELKKDEIFLKNEEEKLLKTKNIVSDEEYQKNFQILSEKFNQYNLKREDYINEINSLKQDEIVKILKKINPIIENYIDMNNIEIVLNKKDIVISKSKYDITNFIIELLDKDL